MWQDLAVLFLGSCALFEKLLVIGRGSEQKAGVDANHPEVFATRELRQGQLAWVVGSQIACLLPPPKLGLALPGR